jgi:hypothetical protein
MNSSMARWMTVWFGVQMVLHFALVVVPTVQHGSASFAGYYTASWLMARGQFTAQAYDNAWFDAQVAIAMQDPEAGEIISPNLPTVGFALFPLVPFHPDVAKAIFAVTSWLASWVALAVVVGLTRPRMNERAEWGWLIGGMLLVWSSPFIANLWMGQIYGFLFLGLVLVGVALIVRKDVGAGAVLGTLFMLKSAGSLLLILPALYRRFGLWVGFGGMAGVLGLASLGWVDVATWERYLEAVGASSALPITTVTAYQTTLGMISHLFRYDEQWNPLPLANAPQIVSPLYLIVTVSALLLTCWILYRSCAPILYGTGLLLLLSIVSVPFAEEHHFIMALLPLLVISQSVRERQGRQRSIGVGLLGLVGIALLLPLPYEHPRLNVGWWAIFAYPRLYGTWLLWGVGCWLAATSPPPLSSVARQTGKRQPTPLPPSQEGD